jgi:hypothetical protein
VVLTGSVDWFFPSATAADATIEQESARAADVAPVLPTTTGIRLFAEYQLPSGLPSVFLPSGLCRLFFYRVTLPSVTISKTFCRVQLGLCRVPQTLGKAPDPGSPRMNAAGLAGLAG